MLTHCFTQPRMLHEPGKPGRRKARFDLGHRHLAEAPALWLLPLLAAEIDFVGGQIRQSPKRMR